MEEAKGVANSETILILARVYDKLNMFKEATEFYKKAIKEPKKKNINAYFFFAQMLEREKKFEDALSNYKLCMRHDKDNFGACLHLANLLSHLNEHQKALKYFQHAYKLDAGSIAANYGLGKCMINSTGNYAGAVKFFKYVVDKDP